MMTIKPIETYAGMLTQEEFVRHYAYLDARIKTGYFPEELSFMMGKAPYYFTDYERMESGARLNSRDLEILNEIFKNQPLEWLSLEKDELHGYQEKRLIRVNVFEDEQTRRYEIQQPWRIKQLTKKMGKPTVFVERIRNRNPKEARKVRAELDYVLMRLKNRGFFQQPRLPYRIYFALTNLANRNMNPFPNELKTVLYQLLHEGKLLLKTIEGQMHYVG